MKRLFLIFAVFALVMLSLLPVTSAYAASFENDYLGCGAGSPCIDGLYQQGDTIHITWLNYGSDGYNVLWSRPGNGGQIHVDGTSATLKTPNHNMTYTFSVEGCDTHFLARSTCTPWSASQQITTT